MQVRLVLELLEGEKCQTTMRWERTAASAKMFELLGRAFEVAQREEGTNFKDALEAFFKGAMIERGDVEEVLKGMGQH